VLVRGRIVVANDAQDGAYEIAHEALLASWSTLLGWLDENAVDHAVRRRIEQAAAEWERSKRPRDLLWNRRKLAEAKPVARDSLAPREAAFLVASRRALVRRRVVIASAAVVLATGAIITGVVLRARARHELEAVVAEQMNEAVTANVAARHTAADRDAARARAFALFDGHAWPAGEDAWSGAEQLAIKEASQYRAASSHFESALALDPTRQTLREGFADLLFERLKRAERDRAHDLAEELAGRLAAYDTGRRQAELDASASVEVDVMPGTKIWQQRGDARDFVGTAPLAPFAVAPGSIVLEFDAPGRVSTRLPVLVGRGEAIKLAVPLPPAEAVPAGMIYVPPGRFLFGSADVTEVRRGFLNSPPMHEVTTGGYLIARHEVTIAEWIEFLDDLPADERKRRSPSALTPQSALTLTEIGPNRWRFSFVRATRTYTAETGEHIHYEHRSKRADQDWMKFPVAAVSYEDALAYASWLDRTKRLPGAHVCDDYEWERAARGADGRTFPNGETLEPDDANIDITYGREPEAFGPDEVGSHPRSRSPVGADDMAGNVWEWTRSVETTDNTPVARGGGWYQETLNAKSVNREPLEPTTRHVWLGVRMCARAP
jgi:formylglycine-generating enzyme required for sulfatase activity